MIIECGHCGAPLDVAQGAGSVKCNYCDTPNQVRSTKTVAQQTPPGWRPPTEWVAPPHVAADSGKTYAYHATRAANTIVLVIVALLLAVGVSIAVGIFFITHRAVTVTTEISRTFTQSGGQGAASKALEEQIIGDVQKHLEQAGIAGIDIKAATAPQQSVLTSEGLKKALDAIRGAMDVEELVAVDLTIHDSHLSIEVQSPDNPEHVNGYKYLRGVVQGPEAERLSSDEKNTLEARLFKPHETAIGRLDELKKEALEKLGYEDAKVTHVIVERDRSKVEMRVYASGPRDSGGYVLFDENGEFRRAFK